MGVGLFPLKKEVICLLESLPWTPPRSLPSVTPVPSSDLSGPFSKIENLFDSCPSSFSGCRPLCSPPVLFLVPTF